METLSPDVPDPILEAAGRPALLSYVRDRRCVLFVGAGLSRPAGYPGWHGLMEALVAKTAKALGDDDASDELDTLLAAGRYAELADQCRETIGRQHFAGILRRELDKPVAPPEATHRPIVETPWAAIVTTNFDTLLEDAYARWSDEGIPKAPTGAQLGRHGTLLLDRAFFILKAHGSIRDAASLVFTSEDYRRITHANPAFQSMMAAILLSHAVVFVGYSLNDPNFRLLLESQLSVFGAQAPPRYAVMDGVGELEAQILKRTAGIEAISYPKGAHENVAKFLSAVASATRSVRPSVSKQAAVLRSRKPLPALCVSVQPRGPMVDVRWFATDTDDPEGVRVPLTESYLTTIPRFPWNNLIAASGSSDWNKTTKIGEILGGALGGLGVPFLEGSQPRLVLLDVPTELAALPWEWMRIKGEPLAMLAPICRRVPGLDDASRGRPFFHSPLRVLLIGDALAESKILKHPLPGTRKEVESIRERFRAASDRHEVTLLAGREASYERVLSEMSGGYDIVHLSGTAYVDKGESVVPLHDGHVRASELAPLLIRNPPGLLFVNEDSSGFVPAFGSEHEIRVNVGGAFEEFYYRMQHHRPGLERVVARAGVGTFVGCMAPANETVASDLAVDFYSHLLDGQPTAHALFLARSARSIEDDHTALLFAMAGYPDTCITETPARARAPVPSGT